METVEEGEGGTNQESSMETYPLLFAKQTASGNSLHDAGSSNPLLCDNLEACDGVGVGGRLKREGTHAFLRLITLVCGRDQHSIVKQSPSN